MISGVQLPIFESYQDGSDSKYFLYSHFMTLLND